MVTLSTEPNPILISKQSSHKAGLNVIDDWCMVGRLATVGDALTLWQKEKEGQGKNYKIN